MKLSPEFVEAAYLRSLAEYVERHVAEQFAGEDKPPLYCEQVMAAEREVPQSAVHHFLCLMRDLQRQAQAKMDSFEMRKKGEGEYLVGVDVDGTLRINTEQSPQPQRLRRVGKSARRG